jgi:hypothetical protein
MQEIAILCGHKGTSFFEYTKQSNRCIAQKDDF